MKITLIIPWQHPILWTPYRAQHTLQYHLAVVLFPAGKKANSLSLPPPLHTTINVINKNVEFIYHILRSNITVWPWWQGRHPAMGRWWRIWQTVPEWRWLQSEHVDAASLLSARSSGQRKSSLKSDGQKETQIFITCSWHINVKYEQLQPTEWKWMSVNAV